MRSIKRLLVFTYKQSTPVTSLSTGVVRIKERRMMEAVRQLIRLNMTSGLIRPWLTGVCPWYLLVFLLGLRGGAEPATDRGG